MTLLTAALAINLAIALVTLGKLRTPGVRSVVVLAFATAAWCACALVAPRATAFPGRLITAAAYLAASAAASAEFTFAVSYSAREHWIKRLPLASLTILPLLTQVLFWIPAWHSFLFGNIAVGAADSSFLVGAWGKVNAAYIYALMGISMMLVWNTFLQRPRTILMPFGAVLIGVLIPSAAATLDFAGLVRLPGIGLLPFGFTLAALTFAFYVFQRRSEAIVSIDRNAVVEGMDDGWMVLDIQNKVVDMNSAAERLTGLPRDKLVGQPVTAMLGNLPDLGHTFNGIQELEMKRSMKSEEGWRYLNIRLSSLYDRHHKPFGRLALWHDVTERKRAEDARQRARDEMLVLLNAIASAASNVVDLDDFLSESIYHIIYPFRSQVIAIFLLDEKSESKEGQRFMLASHLGLPADSLGEISFIPASSPLFASIWKDHLPVQIEDVAGDPRLPLPLREMELACALLVPLTAQVGDEHEVLGCMCLARKEKPVFSQDEIIRLAMISDQIADLIHSDRRRKLAITSSERKRLMRDLHDSVSQKLYGLVTTTEAAQAAIEAGSSVNPTEILARIGENARQAVKEMRLFLFQMQPIDIEKDGLISLLHHRLAAVEGRADIKARLLADLADEEIALSKETEVVLYYIAQEALNNVLRHASAKSISVTLKQGRRNVILEILDDGCGFDPKKVERGGLGLQNMRERTAQIKGKLQIVSKPDRGTRVVITIPKDPSVKPAKHRR